ncbi:MAG: hypothetical protein KDC61_01930 [Saprospiraceae bacterium]|nr:hypothetical protein [Saprospiraceae bacterium]MCB0542083.1 hypothetical protein [Saprospiraceae bacterium]MCB0573308.1 hypothetical protein [Saprospiraceae bacterium]MCB9307455.1 hypothetical protein [Lewinellaceae bacterium]MCB9355298.1 hypothetical protein [Lewinellaceae bacterium]
MAKRQTLLVLLELLWWTVTVIVVVASQYPIHKAMHVWPYEVWNIVFIVVLITLARYTFLLKHTFLARQQVIKTVLILLMFPLIFILIDGLNDFLTFIEEKTWDPLTGHLPAADKKSIEQYIWAEMLFFGAGSIISVPVFAARLLLSIWRTHNRGTV